MTEPFLIYRLPGRSNVVHDTLSVTDTSVLTFGNASIRPWPGEHFGSDSATLSGAGTPRNIYISRVADLIRHLKETGGKTVIARRIAGEFKTFDLDAMVKEYFCMFPDMFCFVFYHPLTGYWMGASPELLLRYDASCGRVDTQALAGTRLRGTGQPWSDKNVAEHRIVVEDMTDRICAAAPTASIVSAPRTTLDYGAIEHLCTPISVNGITPEVAYAIETALHPTAAVGGHPRAEACADIRRIEDAPRRCYGGLISVSDADSRTTYVVLRCVHFDAEHWEIYTGSGVTADSDAYDEWNETATKAEPLVQLLSRY